MVAREQTRGWESLWANLDAPSDYWRTPEQAVVARAGRLWEAGGRRVLDLGCGVGRNTVTFARKGFAIVAADVSFSGLATCTARLTSDGLCMTPVCHEMELFPFSDSAFDGVLAYNVIYHTTLTGMRRTLAGIHRMLRPDGGLYVTIISREDSKVIGYRPDIEMGKCQEIEPFTFIYPRDAPDDKYLPHHYCDEAELRTLLTGFNIDDLSLMRVEYADKDGVIQTGVHYHVQARRV